MKGAIRKLTGTIILIAILALSIQLAYGSEYSRQQMSLIEAIEEISKEYGVYFTMDMTLVSNIIVHFDRKEYNSVEGAISGVLAGTQLAYKIYDLRYVIIYRSDEEGLESLKEMAKHLEGLISDGEENIGRKPRNRRTTPILATRQKQINLRRPSIDVTGTIFTDDGEPLIGATILVKGSNRGTTTDIDGKFHLQDVEENAVLILSYTGYQSMEVAVEGQTVLSLVLHQNSQTLDEVVVTALGISKESKSLTYATQKVGGEELSKVKDLNFVNSLAGKVAGAIITKGTMGPGSTTRVLIRGNKSFTGSSSPLYVIDGVPSSIEFNPDDIESIQILPGASAAALYGSQAANGVVLITTKKAKIGVTTIDFSSSLVLEEVNYLPDLQTKYGRTVPQYNDSWGTQVTNGSDKHLRDFFRTGINKINSISFSNGTDNSQTYLSYANSSSKGVLPENKLSQHNFTLRQSSEFFDDRLTINGSVNYVNRKVFNQNSTGGYSSITGIYSFPIDDDWSKYDERNFEIWDPVRLTYVQNWPYVRNETIPSQNPYWVQKRNETDNFEDKILTSFVAKYRILDWLHLQGRATYDFTVNHYEKRNHASTQATIEGPNGGYGIVDSEAKGLYTDLLLLGSKAFSNLSVSGVLGLSSLRKKDARLSLSSTVPTSLTYPNFFSVYALNGLFDKSERLRETLTEAVFGSISFDYGGRIYFDLTGRKEWSSTVGESFFYPSIGLGYVLKQTSSDLLSYAKLRGSFSEVGNSLAFGIANQAPPYALDNNGNIIGHSTLPFFNGTDTISLKPERTRSFEIGTDLRFVDNSVSLSVTYYIARTYDQVLSIQAPTGSGAQNFWINGGVIENSGIEGILSARLRFGKLSWSPTINFFHNKNRILELSDLLDAEYFVVGFHRTHGNYLTRPKDGQYGSFGDLFGKEYLRDENGNHVVDDSGLPMISNSSDNFIANANPDFFLGINNSLSYRNWKFSFLVDCRFGGYVFDRTEVWLDYKGLSKRTGDARDNGGVLVNGNLVNSKAYYINQTGAGLFPVLSEYLFDMTNVRLRELSFGYTFNKIGNSIENLSLSFIGRNLFFFYKNSPFDPEVGVGSSPSQEGNASFVLPSTRTFGLSVKLSLGTVKGK